MKIQHIGSRPYIPKALHVILDRQRTDRTIANTQHSAPQSIGSQMNCGSIRVAIACYPAFLYLILRAIICLVLPQVASNSCPPGIFPRSRHWLIFYSISLLPLWLLTPVQVIKQIVHRRICVTACSVLLPWFVGARNPFMAIGVLSQVSIRCFYAF